MLVAEAFTPFSVADAVSIPDEPSPEALSYDTSLSILPGPALMMN